MVKITRQAATVIGQTLLQASRENGHKPKVFRLTQLDENFAIQVDTANEGDQVIEYNGEPILVLSQDVHRTLEDATIDVQESPEGPQLVVLQT